MERSNRSQRPSRQSPPLASLLLFADVDDCRRLGRTVYETLELTFSGKSFPEVMVVLRNKGAHPSKRELPLDEIAPLCQRAQVQLLIHSDSNLAFASSLRGMHFSSQSAEGNLQRNQERDALFGRSCHASDSPDRPSLLEWDYLTLSPIFRPTSKPNDSRKTIGLMEAARWNQQCAIPTFALGGVMPHHYPQCMQAGFWGIAVMGGVMGAPDPHGALIQYMDVIRREKV